MKTTRWHSLVAFSLLGALTLAGCTSATTSESGGSSGSGDYSLPADVQAQLDAATEAPDWTPPASSPAPAKDKLVFSIPCSEAAVGCSRPGDAFLEAAKTLGWEAQLIDPAGDPQKIQAAVKQALQLGADGIFMPGGTEQAVSSALLKQARDAGVVMITQSGDQDSVTPSTWSANMNVDYSRTAPTLAAWVAKDSGGEARALAIDDSEFTDSSNGFHTFVEELPKICDTCEIAETMDFSIVDIQTTLPTRVKALLQANPQINYVYAPYDFAAAQVATAIAQAGLSGKVKLVGADGNPQNLQAISDGSQAVTYARPFELMGWAVADQMNRLFNGEPTVDDANGNQTEDYPLQLLSKDNLPEDITEPWDAGIDYQSAYKKLWGLS